MSIILIDSTDRRGTLVRMLEIAATQLGMVVEVIRPDKFRRAAEEHSFADAAVFVPVSQEGLLNGRKTAAITVSLVQSFES